MKKLGNPTTLTALGVVAVVLIALGTILYTNHTSTPTVTAAKAANSKDDKVKSQSAKRASSTGSAASGGSQSANSSAADQAVSAHLASPVTDACKLLTESIAQQIVGSSAQTTNATTTSAVPANDTTITACAYSGSGGSVQLTVRASNGMLGTSENDTEFGSNRPKNAANVVGYGQAAYWNPSTHELNVLGSNNWYIITRSTSSQSDAVAVAKLLSHGF